MWPNIGPIPTYGILYLLGCVLHFIVSHRVADSLGLKRRIWITVSICYVIGMIPGAKLLFHLRHSGFDPMVVFSIKHYVQGGLWGGLLAYLVLAVPVAMLLTRNRRAGLDLVALTIPIPWSLAKVGCLLNGCCNGRPCSLPWAISFREGASSSLIATPVHPTQIYEIIIMVVILMLFRRLNNERWRGTLLFWFIFLYGFSRAGLDAFRGDTERYIYIGSITLTQLVCLVSALSSVVLLFAAKHYMRSKEHGVVPETIDH